MAQTIKVPQLTNDDIGLHSRQQTYKRVSYDRNGDLKASTVKISGAENIWKDTKNRPADPNFVYSPEYRIAGNRRALEDWLSKLGYDANGVNAMLADVYTYQNTRKGGAKNAQYVQELDNYDAFRKVEKERKKSMSKEGVQLDDLEKIVKYIRQYKKESTTSEAPGPKSPRKPRVAKPLLERYNAMLEKNRAEGKDQVLDVSKVTADGRGIRTIKKPGPAAKKVQVGDLRLVSNNEAAYQTALELMEYTPQEVAQLMESYRQTKNASATVRQPMAPAPAGMPTVGQLPTMPTIPAARAPSPRRAPSPARAPSPFARAPSPRAPAVARVPSPRARVPSPSARAPSPRARVPSPRQATVLPSVGLPSVSPRRTAGLPSVSPQRTAGLPSVSPARATALPSLGQAQSRTGLPSLPTAPLGGLTSPGVRRT